MADPTLLRLPERGPRLACQFNRPQPLGTMGQLPVQVPVHSVWHGVRHREKRAHGPERIYDEYLVRDEEWLNFHDYFLVEEQASARCWTTAPAWTVQLAGGAGFCTGVSPEPFCCLAGQALGRHRL